MHQAIDDAPVAPVFGGGLWLWYVLGLGPCVPEQVARDAADTGATGVIIHAVGTAAPQLRWLATAGAALAGLATAVAIGSRGPSRWDDAQASPAVTALHAGYRVMLDDEGAWDLANGAPAARALVAKILGAVPDAVGRVADCAWWKPDAHRGFPLDVFGRLCATRYPQCYPDVGENGLQADGAAAAELAHARAVYPARGGAPATSVYPTVRGYARSTQDACALALAEPHQLVYLGSHGNVMTPDVRRGLMAAARMRAHGSATIADYQRDAGLTPDGLVGPKTLAALGIR